MSQIEFENSLVGVLVPVLTSYFGHKLITFKCLI